MIYIIYFDHIIYLEYYIINNTKTSYLYTDIYFPIAITSYSKFYHSIYSKF